MELKNIGDRFVTGNSENLMSLRKATVTDVFEVSSSEHFFEIEEYKIIKGHNYKKTSIISLN
jgi:hypothetical protein